MKGNSSYEKENIN